ncbi:MAG: GNAT family N-acetyltransferase [Acidobacteria bacterium]|nr:GNAT family N-acetyltransferase [Acidobacteriota bacterium]
MSTAGKETAMPAHGIEVRHCHALAEFERCMELEREVWGGTERDQVPATIFVVADETGGQVLGAYDREHDGRMVGFTLAMAGMHGEQRYLHSHMTAVAPAYQNRGIGRMLKLFQREDALRRGIELVEWTFDPLEIRNAYFNIVRLGAIVRRFKPNVYGITSSPLHGGMPTDRLVAEWWLKSARVVTALEKGSVQAGWPSRSGLGERIIVPREMTAWKTSDPAKAAEAQRCIGEEFQRCLERGWAVTGLELSDTEDRYLLVPFGEVPGMKP